MNYELSTINPEQDFQALNTKAPFRGFGGKPPSGGLGVSLSSPRE